MPRCCPPCARLLLALTLLPAAAAAAAAAAAGALPEPGPATVLLVVAPHPDDETLCCAGAMQRVRAAGGRVAVVWLTSGDGSRLGSLLLEHRLLIDPARMRAYGARRMAEARVAAGRLGVAASAQLFLGYPDGALAPLLDDPAAPPRRSRYTDAAAVPYPDALFPQHPYSGASLARDFAAVLALVQPTLVLAPSERDGHPDHQAAARLARVALAGRPAVQLRLWIVHGGAGWPAPRTLMPGVPLPPPPRAGELNFVPFELSVAEEDTKLAALRAYETQLQVLGPFLEAFVRTSERFARAAPP